MNSCFRFFCNKDCEYFPCHKTEKPDEFNCLFCYCPLYTRDDCGGTFDILPTDPPIKDCSRCMIPHDPNGYDHIMKKLAEK